MSTFASTASTASTLVAPHRTAPTPQVNWTNVHLAETDIWHRCRLCNMAESSSHLYVRTSVATSLTSSWPICERCANHIAQTELGYPSAAAAVQAAHTDWVAQAGLHEEAFDRLAALALDHTTRRSAERQALDDWCDDLGPSKPPVAIRRWALLTFGDHLEATFFPIPHTNRILTYEDDGTITIRIWGEHYVLARIEDDVWEIRGRGTLRVLFDRWMTPADRFNLLVLRLAEVRQYP